MCCSCNLVISFDPIELFTVLFIVVVTNTYLEHLVGNIWGLMD